MNEWGGHLAGMASRRWTSRCRSPAYPRGSTCWCSTRWTAAATSTSTSRSAASSRILRAPADAVARAATSTEADFLQPGPRRWPPAMRIYGPTTMLVLTVGNGVAGFTLTRIGEFMLTHPKPACRRRHAGVRHQHQQQPLLGTAGQALRVSTSAWPGGRRAAGLQHALDRQHGGRGAPHPDARRRVPVPARHQATRQAGRLRLLYEANPIGDADGAGRRAAPAPGASAMLGVKPPLHQRVGR